MSMALPAKAADGKISGTFVDENGAPLGQGPEGEPGVVIVIWPSYHDVGCDPYYSVGTGPEGSFTTETGLKDTNENSVDHIPAGTYTLRFMPKTAAAKTAYGPQKQGDGTFKIRPLTLKNVEATAEGTDITDLIKHTVLQDANVSGTLYNPDEIVVAGASVNIHNYPWTTFESSITNAAGEFAFYVAANDYYEIEADVPEGENWLPPASIRDIYFSSGGSATGQDLSYTTLNVKGEIKTPTGTESASNPYPDTKVPDAHVFIHNTSWSVERHTNTNPQGQFTFGGIPDDNYEIEFEPPRQIIDGKDFSAYARAREKVTTGSGAPGYDSQTGITDLGTKRFSLPNFVGQVTLPDGTTPVADAWINMNDVNGGAWFGANTDAEGKFKFKVEAGKYAIEAEPPTWKEGYEDYCRTRKEIVVNPADIDEPGEIFDAGIIKLTTPNITGKVYKPDGVTPLQNVWVNVDKVITQWERWWVSGANTDMNGTFRLNLSEAGTYQLRLEVPWNFQGVYAPSTYTLVLDTDLKMTSLKDEGKNELKDTMALTDLNLKLTDPSINGLEVTVKDPKGNAAQGVWMGLRQEGVYGGMDQWIGVNEQGIGIFANIAVDEVYKLEINPPWGADYSRATYSLIVTDREKPEGVDLKATATGEGKKEPFRFN